jgi:hypothetical protein
LDDLLNLKNQLNVREPKMKKEILYITISLVTLFAFRSFAEQTTGENAKAIVTALRLTGLPVNTIHSVPRQSTNLSCTVSWNGALEITHPDFLIPGYHCQANTRKIIGAQAKILFDALSAAIGSDTAMGKSTVSVQFLNCSVDITKLETSARFYCSYSQAIDQGLGLE